MSPKILATGGGAVDRVKFVLTSSLITVQNIAAVSCTVCAHVGGPQNLKVLTILETLGALRT